MMHDKATGISIFCAVLALLAGCSARPKDPRSFALVTAGRPSAVIVATGDKTVDADIAFFTNAVARMTGAGIEVKAISSSSVNLNLQPQPDFRIVFEIEKRPITEEDRYEISFPDAQTMKIVGTDMSCRWALNALLEEAGVVFCLPGPHGTHYPQLKTLAYERRVRTDDASIRLERDLYTEDPAWQRAMNGKHQPKEFRMHNLAQTVLPPEKYAKDPWREQVMPLHKGKRIVPSRKDVGWQNCYASDVGVEEAVKNIAAYLEKHPEEKAFSISMNDFEGYCECEGCRVLNGGELTAHPKYGTPRHTDHSRAYYTWVNRVLEKVGPKFPNVFFGLLAYCGTIDPPPFKLHPQAVVYLCVDSQQFADPEMAARHSELFRLWGERASHIGIWDYGFGTAYYTVPRIYTRDLEKFFALKAEIPSFDAGFCEGSSFWGCSLERYMYYRYMWKSDLDRDAELDRWCRACVGAAAAADLRRYYELWEDFWHSDAVKKTFWWKGRTSVYFSYDSKNYVFALSPETLAKADRLMDRVVAAAEASGDAEQALRARRLAGFQRYFAARSVECGAGCGANEMGRLTNAVAAARYVRSLPKIVAAHESAVREREAFAAWMTQEPMIHTVGRLAQLRRLMLNPDLMQLLNGVIEYKEKPEVVAALKELAADKAFTGEMATIVRNLADPSACAECAYNRGTDAASDLKMWQRVPKGTDITPEPPLDGSLRYRVRYTAKGQPWAVKTVYGLKYDNVYLCHARVHNPLKHSIHFGLDFVSLHDDTPDGNVGGSGGFESARSIPVPAGATREVSVLARTSPECRNGKILVMLGNMEKGEEITFDQFSVRDMMGK